MPQPTLDDYDAGILRALQDNARLTVAQVADQVHLSSSPTWRRMRRLEDDGLITAYRATVDRRALGWGVLAFVSVSIEDHGEQAARRFAKAVTALPEIVACWSVSGDSDFLLQVVSRDLDTYAEFAMTSLGRLPGIKAMRTSFTLTELKPFTAWPVPDSS